MMKLNQDYVMSQAAYQDAGSKKDPEALEELDRQLRYMERSIATLKVNTIKNETRTQNDIKKRTKENTQLLVELNSIKLEVKKLANEIQKKQQQYQKLEIEISVIKRESVQGNPTNFAMEAKPASRGSLIGSPSGAGPAFMMLRQRGKESQLSGKAANEDKARITELGRQVEENN